MAVSFEKDIRPLFTDMDIAHMKDRGAALDDFDYVRENAQTILAVVSTGAMPPPRSGEASWPPERVQLLGDWINAGCQP